MNLKMFFDCINAFLIFDFILNFKHTVFLILVFIFLSNFVSDLHIWTSGDFYFSSCAAPFLRCLFSFLFFGFAVLF